MNYVSKIFILIYNITCMEIETEECSTVDESGDENRKTPEKLQKVTKSHGFQQFRKFP